MKLNCRWRVNLGLASICVYLRGKYRKFWSRRNDDVRRSKLFMHDEPKSSVRYRCSCLRSEVRSFLHATWHSIIIYIYITFWSRENDDVSRSRLSMYDEPKSSVRYHSSCLRSEVRSFYMCYITFCHTEDA